MTTTLQRKIDKSIALMQQGESLALQYDPADGYWLGFSGGKDSQCLYHLAQLAGVKFRAHFSATSVDPPEVIRFVRRQYPDVEIIPAKMSIYAYAKRNNILPTMRYRWCCAEFKETGGAGKVVLTGVRREESPRRAARNAIEVTGHKFSGNFETFAPWQEQRLAKARRRAERQRDQFSAPKESEIRCISGLDRIILNPMLDWTETEVWQFLNDEARVPHCELYDPPSSQRRIGCILCPMSSAKRKQEDIRNYPYVRDKWMDVIRGLLFPPPHSRFNIHEDVEANAEDYFDWWISGKGFKKWYADKYAQLSIDFNDTDDTEDDTDPQDTPLG